MCVSTLNQSRPIIDSEGSANGPAGHACGFPTVDYCLYFLI